MRKLLQNTILVFFTVLLFMHQQGYAQCTLTSPANVSLSAAAGKCGAFVTYTAPAVPAGCSSTQKIDTNFAFTATQQTFVVPAGVTSVTIQTWGAQGGGGDDDNNGGLGGYATGSLSVQPGDILYVYVGGQPLLATTEYVVHPGGYNGGGSSYSLGGGGGGGSDVRTAGSTLSNRIMVAGGGGGRSEYTGGAGGGLTGTSGGVCADCVYMSGYDIFHVTSGGGGTQTEGGAHGTNGDADGSLGQGGGEMYGAGMVCGGGGGYYGGGAGSNYGGGGGGSGYVGGVTDGSMQTGVNSGNGKVVISYNGPATLSVVQTGGLSSGSLFPVGVTTNSFALVSSNGDTLSKCSSVITVTDNEKPVIQCPGAQKFCFNTSGTYSIPQPATSDNCSVQGTSYSITGTTKRSGTGNDASGAFNPGLSTITWTVTDIHGNQNTCQTAVTINPQINVSIPDVKALSSGVNVNTVYIGYAPASMLTLTANASGGSGSFTYKWSTGATTQSIKVSPAAITSYTVTVTDGNKCSATSASKQVNVTDVRCGNNKDKTTVCHSNGSLCINNSDVAAHLAHGDYLGSCQAGNTVMFNSAAAQEITYATEALHAYPNPSKGQFVLQLNNSKAAKAHVLVLDVNGAVVERRDVYLTPGMQTLNFNLGNKANGLYLLKVISADKVQTVKAVLQK